MWNYYKRELNTCLGWLIGGATQPLLFYVSFALFLYHGNTMTVANAFAAMRIIQMIRWPLGWVPHFIRNLSEFRSSMERIQKYLACPEINTDFVAQTLDPSGKVAIKIKDSNFSWGGKKEEKKDEDKEK